MADLIAQVWPFDPAAFWRGFAAGAMVVLAVILTIEEDRNRG